MAPQPGEFWTKEHLLDGRQSVRRTLRLSVPALSSWSPVDVLLRNISLTGMLIETNAGLEIGQSIEVDLPQAGKTAALVAWASGSLFGCQFAVPISAGAVSAALLRAPFGDAPAPSEAPSPELVRQRHPAPDQELSLRKKTLIIVGLTAILWAAILLVVRML